MADDKFLHVYQSVKFKEDPANCYSMAATKRLTMALNFYGSIERKESNHVTEFLLEEDLREYVEIVENSNSVHGNIYVDYVLSLLSNNQNDNLKYWKSGLDEIDIQDLLEPLPCSNDITCKYSELAPTELNELQSAFDQYTKLKENEALKNIKRPNDNIIPEKKFLVNNNPTSSKNLENEPVKKNFHIEENVPKPKESFYFRTAKDELEIQSAKKFGKGGNSGASDKGLNYGTVKKSLGTRKGGVFGKFQPPVKSKNSEEQSIKMEVDEFVDERLKNIDPAMIELIKNEIMDCGTKITWNDIAGLNLAKNTIQEIVVWPMLRPDIFTGLRRPPKGILLFGPPGTGKTLIGKCIASQSNSTFFSISASSLTSKWVGDGEKMVRTLFAVAKVHQPSVVFIDEIDSLLSQRSDSEHECSRRIKTEFLVQLDGAGTGDEDRILIIGATNRPQELDEAARRRLVKRLYIPLPDENARKQIIENLISAERHSLTESEIENIAKLTKGYSGADVKNLCQEASLGPIRSIPPMMIQSISPEDVRPLNSKDFESALCRIKSSVSESDLDVYVAWDKQYGCGAVSQSG